MRRVPLSLMCTAFLASLACHGEEPTVAIGKKLAVESGVQWTVREIDHVLLGPIQFATRKNEVATAVRNEKIFSNAYVSCQRKTATVAIELTNAPGTDLAGGLGPADLPRLVCSSPGPQGSLVKSDLAASWEIGTLGDTLARGLSPAALRQCVAIDVVQNLALPRKWPQQTQRVEMRITPYAKELDTVFVRCGEPTAFAIDEVRPAAPPQARAAPTAPAARATPAPQEKDSPWVPARATAKGKTNVRAAPSVDSAVVVHLDPGALILVQKASPPWWRVRPAKGEGFSGYIREDRLELERPRR